MKIILMGQEKSREHFLYELKTSYRHAVMLGATTLATRHTVKIEGEQVHIVNVISQEALKRDETLCKDIDLIIYSAGEGDMTVMPDLPSVIDDVPIEFFSSIDGTPAEFLRVLIDEHKKTINQQPSWPVLFQSSPRSETIRDKKSEPGQRFGIIHS